MYRALGPGHIGVKVPFVEAAKLATKYGFQGISVGMADVEALGVGELRRTLVANKLLPAFCGLPVTFIKDEATFEEGMARLPAFAKAMADAGCQRCITWFPSWHDTLSYEDNFRQMSARLRRICEVLTAQGVRFGIEFVGPKTLRAGKAHEYIHTIDGTLTLIEAVGSDNLGFLLDAFHWYTSEATATDLAKLSDKLVVAVHVNDAMPGRSPAEQIDGQRDMPCKTGVIDLRTFMRSLASMCYTGPVIVEPFCAWVRVLPPDEAVAATAQALDKLWEVAGL